MANGTLTVSDLIASSATVVQIGEDNIFQSIETARIVHNNFVNEKYALLIEKTNERAARYGGPDGMTMDKIGEFGTADAQKIAAGSRVEFPLYNNGVSVQWTRAYMLNATAKELAEQFVATQDADLKAIDRDIKIALFSATNRSVIDRRVDNMALNVKALANADGAGIPMAPDGTTFNASTHTHYLYTAGTALAASDVNGLSDTIIEHFNDGRLVIWINRAQQAAISALSGFTPITPGFVNPATNAISVVQNFDLLNPNNRQIGFFGSNWAEVWVKPWIPVGYLFAYMQGAKSGKPLMMRTRAGNDGLVIAADTELHPLRAKTLEREFGIGAYNRVNGACLYIDTGAAGAYVVPTIN